MIKMQGMKYGYARVSTDDQKPALQLDALKLGAWRHVDRVETGQVGPERARLAQHPARPTEARHSV